jgi:hypothetical protein
MIVKFFIDHYSDNLFYLLSVTLIPILIQKINVHIILILDVQFRLEEKHRFMSLTYLS